MLAPICAALVLASMSMSMLACRRAPKDEVKATPVFEQRDASIEIADATPGDAHETSTDDEVELDPCRNWGPAAGEPCAKAGLICLSSHRGGGMQEIACDGRVWKTSKAAPFPTGPKLKCPTIQPVSGTPCTGAAQCQFGACGGAIDPSTGMSTFDNWITTWTCYRGAWRRYDDPCFGE